MSTPRCARRTSGSTTTSTVGLCARAPARRTKSSRGGCCVRARAMSSVAFPSIPRSVGSRFTTSARTCSTTTRRIGRRRMSMRSGGSTNILLRSSGIGGGGAGRRISDCGFYQAWRRAREAAGCAGSIPHDFRRTAIRNMVRARISERVAMKLSGHKTRSVFDRYNVVSDGDLRDAARRLGHTGGHTSPSLAFGGGEKAQNP